MDTIYALSSAQGKAGVAVIRISGAEAFPAIKRLSGDVPSPRRASLRRIRSLNGQVLDDALILTFKKNGSFTGEDTVEIQCHGGIAVISAVMKSLSELGFLRLAEPGEFTRRALENNRLDLTQTEGLADLIDAETEAQRKQAFRVLEGHLGAKTDKWREYLIKALSLLEVTIDFVDEEVPTDVEKEVTELLQSVLFEIKNEISGISAAERIRTGFEVAIIGAPNVGKSTLLNFLAGREAAITSEHAGTTRDVIEVRMDIAGFPVTLLDTAGIRETDDEVEALGIELARQRARDADLRIFLKDAADLHDVRFKPEDLVRVSKVDLRGGEGISGRTGHGIPELINAIGEILKKKASSAGVATKERHRIALSDAVENLGSAMNCISSNGDTIELAAEEIRTALHSLNVLVGRVDVDHILDEIFSSFCLGK